MEAFLQESDEELGIIVEEVCFAEMDEISEHRLNKWARLGKKALIWQLYKFQFSVRGQLLKDFKELRGIPKTSRRR